MIKFRIKFRRKPRMHKQEYGHGYRYDITTQIIFEKL